MQGSYSRFPFSTLRLCCKLNCMYQDLGPFGSEEKGKTDDNPNVTVAFKTGPSVNSHHTTSLPGKLVNKTPCLYLCSFLFVEAALLLVGSLASLAWILTYSDTDKESEKYAYDIRGTGAFCRHQPNLKIT